MANDAATGDRPVVKPGPSEIHDPVILDAFKRAAVWIGLGSAVFLAWQLAQPLMLVFGGIVVAAMLDGGVRLLGRVLPIGRGWRLLIIGIAVLLFMGSTIYLLGVELVAQANQLRVTLEAQTHRLSGWLSENGFMPTNAQLSDMGRQLLGSLGQVTAAVGTALGAVTSLFLILVIGLFLAMEPRLYERGLEWMTPARHRANMRETSHRMGFTLRRLLAGRLFGMLAEGILTWVALSIGGVPMALLLGIITGILAFIPNIGAFIAGALTIAVGFSAGLDTGIWAIGVYVVVQTFDGYVVIPTVAKRTVDLAPALVLAAQLLFGALFGILGLALADPLLAMIKVALERRSEQQRERSPLANPS